MTDNTTRNAAHMETLHAELRKLDQVGETLAIINADAARQNVELRDATGRILHRAERLCQDLSDQVAAKQALGRIVEAKNEYIRNLEERARELEAELEEYRAAEQLTERTRWDGFTIREQVTIESALRLYPTGVASKLAEELMP